MSEHRRYLADLGFASSWDVTGLLSVAHLFRRGASRCGLYLLTFESGDHYIGQARDAVRRFAQHRQRHFDIVAYSFQPCRPELLDLRERACIQQAEEFGVPLTNRVHVSAVRGETELDFLVPRELQDRWLETGSVITPSRPPILPLAEQRRRYRHQYEHLRGSAEFASVVDVLRAYVSSCLLSPAQTQYSFWSATCLPSTNRSVAPRFAAINVNAMETFVLGHEPRNVNAQWAFVVVAKSALLSTYQSASAIRRAHPSAELFRRGYRAAGTDQMTIYVPSMAAMLHMLHDDAVRDAAKLLALRLMRKGGTIYSKFHCPDLAEALLDAAAA